MILFSLAVGYIIWAIFYNPIHDRMPWSYKNYIRKNGIKINRSKRDWD